MSQTPFTDPIPLQVYRDLPNVAQPLRHALVTNSFELLNYGASYSCDTGDAARLAAYKQAAAMNESARVAHREVVVNVPDALLPMYRTQPLHGAHEVSRILSSEAEQVAAARAQLHESINTRATATVG